MRAIKFRAFYKGDIEEWEHNGNARMIYDIQNAYDGTGFDDPENGFGWVSCFSDFMDDEKMSVMQYTGLKDKNGVEIYEGDILSIAHLLVENIAPHDVVVEWDKARFATRIIGDATQFKFPHVTPHGIFGPFNTLDTFGKDVEVIGNIYEHPELLKE